MLNILIVDDEYYSAKSTMVQVQNRFVNVFDDIACAYSMEDALVYIESRDPAVMICDIEMPGGSGLDLLQEIRNRNKDTICIFLTAYAKFEYVSTALRLSSVDYLLKPVEGEELEKAVNKALSVYRGQQLSKSDRQAASSWLESLTERAENFWNDLARGVVDTGALAAEFRKRGLELAREDRRVLPLLIQCVVIGELPFERGLHDFIVRNIVREYFYLDGEAPSVIRIDDTLYCLPLDASKHEREDVLNRCVEALEDFVPHFPHAINFYVAPAPCSLQGFRESLEELKKSSRENVSLENHVFDLARESVVAEGSAAVQLPVKHWTALLEQRDDKSLQYEAEVFLKKLRYSGEAKRETLRTVYHRFLNLLLSVIGERAPQMLDAFHARMIPYAEEDVTESFHAMEQWMKDGISAAAQCLAQAEPEDQTVALVQKYIHEHLAEELSRELLAQLVYLTPDYLSHLFKKETGLSLTNYVIHERIENAKKLILTTNLSVQDIALQCGFQNISYFARQFRSSTGKTPREYRRDREEA